MSMLADATNFTDRQGAGAGGIGTDLSRVFLKQTMDCGWVFTTGAIRPYILQNSGCGERVSYRRAHRRSPGRSSCQSRC